MKEIKTHHIVNKANRRVRVFAEDEQGPGGGHWHYRLSVCALSNQSGVDTHLRFHHGELYDAKKNPQELNGITNEALIAVVIDRLKDFSKGEFSCRENSLAITKLEEALLWLGARSVDRESRGVEGYHKS